MSIDGQTEKQIVPNLLFKVYTREPHNSVVGTTEEGGLKESRKKKIISSSVIQIYETFLHSNWRIFMHVKR